MSVNSPQSNKDSASPSWTTTLTVCLVVAAIGAGILYFIFNTEPTARRSEGAKTTAMLVDVTSADTGTFRPGIEVMGTVEPAQDVVLRPRVSGKIIDRAEEFTPGGFVEEDEKLLQLDESDFRNDLEQRQSEFRQARTDLKIEMGRQDVAREEYELLEENLSEKNRALVLREPQLEAARAQVESARAAIDQAQLELNRTSVEAPFDAQIIERNVNVGSQVSAGDNLARMVGLDTYWIETTMPLSDLRWLDVPDTPGEIGPKVRIRDRSAWSEGEYRMGRLYKLVGELEDQARMARVLVSVDDPLAMDATNADSPPLIIGSYVETSIRGEKIKNVVRLNRDYVRNNDTVWVMEDGKLDIRNVDIVYKDEGYAYIRRGLSSSEKIVTTNLTTVVDGTPLRLQGNNSAETSKSETSGNKEASDGSV